MFDTKKKTVQVNDKDLAQGEPCEVTSLLLEFASVGAEEYVLRAPLYFLTLLKANSPSLRWLLLA